MVSKIRRLKDSKILNTLLFLCTILLSFSLVAMEDEKKNEGEEQKKRHFPLLNLPDELILAVCSHLSTQEASSLSLCNQLLHSLLTPEEIVRQTGLRSTIRRAFDTSQNADDELQDQAREVFDRFFERKIMFSPHMNNLEESMEKWGEDISTVLPEVAFQSSFSEADWENLILSLTNLIESQHYQSQSFVIILDWLVKISQVFTPPCFSDQTLRRMITPVIGLLVLILVKDQQHRGSRSH